MKPKLCTDCRWHGLTTKEREHICKRPGVGKLSAVNGANLYPGCQEERENIVAGFFTYLLSIAANRCGPRAKHFAPLTTAPESAE